jgi:tetratricopeptide (TPR) repeat protein
MAGWASRGASSVISPIAFSMALMLGCASPRVGRPPPRTLADADAELLAGCYDCLLNSRASYRWLATVGGRASVIVQVFETDLLIALREKEVGIPPSDAIVEARRIATELPSDLQAARYISLVDALPSEVLGLPHRDTDAFGTAHAWMVRRAAEEQAWLAQGKLRKPVRDYMRLALDCAYPTADEGMQTSALPPDAAPLLRYRAAICGGGFESALSDVRAREPRFVETAFFIAKGEVAGLEMGSELRGDRGQAKARLAEVLARFPSSAAIAFLTANDDLLAGEWAEALRFYDRTLALQPAHETALLGRTICFNHLDRIQEAIESSSQLIALGADNVAEAYYWRAWSRHKLGQLAEARADVSVAKGLLAAPRMFSLAGVIEHDQGDLDPAQADLETAILAVSQDCTAHWYLGLVQQRRKSWLPSGRAFEHAMVCYRERARSSMDRIDALRARNDISAEYRARQIADLEVSVEADIRQQHLAAFTAAVCDAAGGDIVAAKGLLELAEQDPTLADRAAKLRSRLDKPRGSLR